MTQTAADVAMLRDTAEMIHQHFRHCSYVGRLRSLADRIEADLPKAPPAEPVTPGRPPHVAAEDEFAFPVVV